MQTILLGSVAIEPTRWDHLRTQKPASPVASPIVLSPWLAQIADAGFDGVEVWERHITDAPPAEVAAIHSGASPMTVFNSYTSLDEVDSTSRQAVADHAVSLGSSGIKFNVGNNADQQMAYGERIAAWLDLLPAEISLLCECHHGISIAEDPAVAAAIFAAAAPADRLKAIVHTHEDPDHIRARFDAYGDRVAHVHVNFLDFATMSAPRLADIRPRLESQVALLQSLGFDGSWTIEFTHGILTPDDHPEFLLNQAAEDLAVLQDVLS